MSNSSQQYITTLPLNYKIWNKELGKNTLASTERPSSPERKAKLPLLQNLIKPGRTYIVTSNFFKQTSLPSLKVLHRWHILMKLSICNHPILVQFLKALRICHFILRSCVHFISAFHQTWFCTWKSASQLIYFSSSTWIIKYWNKIFITLRVQGISRPVLAGSTCSSHVLNNWA